MRGLAVGRFLLMAFAAAAAVCVRAGGGPEEKFRAYADRFAALDTERSNSIPNAAAADFLAKNVPFFECPDPEIELTYAFRWWTYRKHLVHAEGGWRVSEFDDERAIACPVGHHLREGRWLRDRRYLDDYTRYWFGKGASPLHGPRSYVNWIVQGVLAREEVTGDTALADGLLDAFVANYEAWEAGWDARPWPKEGMYRMGLKSDGLFHDVDDREGTELTLSGNGARVHVNAIMYGEAAGISKIAARCGRKDLAKAFEERASRLETKVKTWLWNEELRFFTPRSDDGTLTGVCELHGYTPWFAGMPLEGRYAAAWRRFSDTRDFSAPFGLSFAAQSAPGFRISYEGHGCQWNGPIWPFATSIALTALADRLHAGERLPAGRADWFSAFRRYALSHRQTLADGRRVPWIDECQDPFTGNWIAYKRWQSVGGRAYNHSTFCDLVISGLVGLRIAADGSCVADPLIPDDWNWFRLSNVPVHDRMVTVTFDRDGRRFGGRKGLEINSRKGMK